MSDPSASRRAIVRTDLVWQAAWSNFKHDAQETLDAVALEHPVIWDCLVPDNTEPDAMILKVVAEIFAPPEGATGWADMIEHLLILIAASENAIQGKVERAARLGSYQVALEQGLRKRRMSSRRSTRT